MLGKELMHIYIVTDVTSAMFGMRQARFQSTQSNLCIELVEIQTAVPFAHIPLCNFHFLTTGYWLRRPPINSKRLLKQI